MMIDKTKKRQNIGPISTEGREISTPGLGEDMKRRAQMAALMQRFGMPMVEPRPAMQPGEAIGQGAPQPSWGPYKEQAVIEGAAKPEGYAPAQPRQKGPAKAGKGIRKTMGLSSIKPQGY